MDSIYSKIIWEKLKKKDYQIHLQAPQKTDRLVKDFFDSMSSTGMEQFLKEELAWVDVEDSGEYYDGVFWNITQSNGSVLKIHDCGVIPTLLYVLMKTRISAGEVLLMKQILDMYYKKIKEEERADSSEPKYT